MRIYTKILLITLPLVFVSILAGGIITYIISRNALTEMVDHWLASRLTDAVDMVDTYNRLSTTADPNDPVANLSEAQSEAKVEISNQPINQEGNAFVVDQSGNILVQPKTFQVGKTVASEAWFKEMQSAASGRLIYTWNGTAFLGKYQLFEPWGWYILVAEPLSMVYASAIRAGIIAFALASVGLVLVGFIVTSFARQLTKPLRHLQEGAIRIGQGELSTRLDGKTDDELGSLANVFNQMAAQLQASLEALQHSENLYRAMIENGTDLIYVTDPQGIITYASPISLKSLGYRPEEMLGTSAFDYVYPQDRESVQEAFRGVIQKTRDLKALEFRLRHKDGAWLSYEAVAANLLDDPVVSGVIVNCRDLKERKQAQKLQDSIYQISESAFKAENMEDLFRAMHAIISELMPAQNFYVALYDEGSQLLHFPYYIDEYDEPPGPTRFGRGLTEYVLSTGEPLLASPEKFDELVREGKVDEIGAPSIDWLGVPLRTSEKTLGVLVVQSYTENVRFNEVHKSILTFVSEQAAMSIARKKIEEALRESETRYRGLFEDSPISLWEEDFSEIKKYIDDLRLTGVTDFKKYFDEHAELVSECMSRVRVIDVNHTTLRMYAAHSKEEILSNLNRIFGPETLELVKRELIAIADHQQEFEGAGVNYRINGSRIDIVIRWLAFPDDQGAYSRIIVSIMDITERRRVEEQVQSQIQRLNALRAIDTSITGSLDLRSTLNVLLEQVTTQLNVDAAAVLLLDQNILALEYAAGRGFRTAALQHTHLRLGEGHAGRAALERTLISNPDLLNDPGKLINSPLLEQEDFVAYYALPLIAKGQVKGVLEIFHRSPLQPSQEWLEFLETLGRQAAIAIDNASLFNDLQHSNLELTLAYDATIVGWSRALDLRDRETEGHTQRVTELTVRLAQLVGVPKKDLVFLRWGALLHDIGKMGIPDSILLKPGPLTSEEHATMRQHPVYAYQMLLPIHYLRPALDIPYYHHERWDGKGYPCGLKGDEIPLSARIFSIVDVYDALCSERPYREAWPEEKALRYIENQSGLHFDPLIVTAFMTMIGDSSIPDPIIQTGQVRLEA